VLIASPGGTQGDDPKQVFKDLRAMVADVVESYRAEGNELTLHFQARKDRMLEATNAVALRASLLR
jgi:hypothetical protein